MSTAIRAVSVTIARGAPFSPTRSPVPVRLSAVPASTRALHIPSAPQMSTAIRAVNVTIARCAQSSPTRSPVPVRRSAEARASVSPRVPRTLIASLKSTAPTITGVEDVTGVRSSTTPSVARELARRSAQPRANCVLATRRAALTNTATLGSIAMRAQTAHSLTTRSTGNVRRSAQPRVRWKRVSSSVFFSGASPASPVLSP